VDLPSLPKRGKTEGDSDYHEANVNWIQQNLKIDFLDGTGVLRIGLTAGSTRDQVLLVNAVARAYLKEIIRRDRDEYEMRLEGLKSQLQAWQGAITAFDKRKGKGMDKEVKANIEHTIEEIKTTTGRLEFDLRTLPQLLEFAEAPTDS
jgi:hypothetical protein